MDCILSKRALAQEGMASSQVGSSGICGVLLLFFISVVVLGTTDLDRVFMMIKYKIGNDNNSHFNDINSNFALIPNMM